MKVFKWFKDNRAAILYALFIILFTIVFFTNDYGLTDIRKTSVVVGLGIDTDGDGVVVTAQIAVPQPSESGENTKFTQIEGQGKSVGEAINDVNAKAGFYPKLVFCKLIILGESCKQANIFTLLDYFYRNEHTQLTPVVAMCDCPAGELLNSQLPFGDTATVTIERLLSDESKKTGNVSTVNLKCLGLLNSSVSGACYMPYLSASGLSAGEQQPSNESGQGGTSQGGSGTEQSGGQGGSENATLTCSQTAIFKDGMFCGVLDENQAFALNLVRNEIRHAFVACGADSGVCTLGLRSCDGKIKLTFNGDVPVLKIQFKGVAQLQDEGKSLNPMAQASRVVDDEILSSGCQVIQGYFEQLLTTVREQDCDVLGAKKLLHRYNYSRYEENSQSLLENMQVEYDIQLKSAA